MNYYNDILKGVIFDLDGVITDTAKYHYLAWKTLSDDLGIYFDEVINQQLKGVSRMASLNIILQKSNKIYTDDEKLALAEKKNKLYLKLLKSLKPTDILPGIPAFLAELKKDNKKIALGSASKNALIILKYLNIEQLFDTIVCGLDTKKSKPDPEVFLLGAKRLGLLPSECLVIEDAAAGIEAALNGNMKAIGIGDHTLEKATILINNTSELTTELLRTIE